MTMIQIGSRGFVARGQGRRLCAPRARPTKAVTTAIALVLVMSACSRAPATTTPTTAAAATAPSSSQVTVGASAASTADQLQPGQQHSFIDTGLKLANFAGDGNLLASTTEGTAAPAIVILDPSGNRLSAVTDASRFNSDCAVDLRQTDKGVDVLLGMTIESTPAAGINPATNKAHLYAWDARTAQPLWDAVVPGSDDNADAYCASGSYFKSMLQTSDNRWMAGLFPATSPTIIDLDTGQTHQQPGVIGVAGDELVSTASGNGSITLLRPDNGAITGASTDRTATGSANRMAALPAAHVAVTSESSGRIVGVGLPTAQIMWTTTVHGADSTTMDYADTINNIADVFMYDGGGGSPATAGTVYALDPTGHVRWQQDVAYVCGTMNGKLVVTANNQLAILDNATGKQLSYRSDIMQCPFLLGGGYAFANSEVLRLF